MWTRKSVAFLTSLAVHATVLFTLVAVAVGDANLTTLPQLPVTLLSAVFRTPANAAPFKKNVPALPPKANTPVPFRASRPAPGSAAPVPLTPVVGHESNPGGGRGTIPPAPGLPGPQTGAAPATAPALGTPAGLKIAAFPGSSVSGGDPAARGAQASVGAGNGIGHSSGDATGSGSVTSWMEAYGADVKVRIESRKNYPPAARRSRLTGDVVLSFDVSRDGSLHAATIARSSGSALLDRAALASLRAAAPFSPFPVSASAANQTFNITLTFRLQ